MTRTSVATGLALVALLVLVSWPAGAGSLPDRVLLDSGRGSAAAHLAELDDVGAPGAALSDEPSAFERIGAALLSAGGAVVDVVGAALSLAGDAALLIGRGLAFLGGALVDGAVWIGVRIGQVAVALGRGLAWLGVHALDGTIWVGARLVDGIAWSAVLVGSLLADLGRALAAAWPSDPKNQAIVGGVAGGAAAAGVGAWTLRPWRYLRYATFLAPLYARITREELLDHPVRARLVETVRGHPGVHVSELARDLQLPWGTLLHHLDKLQRAGLLVSTDAGARRCLFLPGQVASEQRRIIPALDNDTARSIAEYYAAHPGACQKTASTALDLSPALVSWHVKRLEAAGVITRTRDGRSVRIGVTGDALAALA